MAEQRTTEPDGPRLQQVLQYQADLLERLAVTSGMATRWREKVGAVLLAAADVLGAAFFCAYLRGEDEKQDLELFWPGAPSPELKAEAEATASRRLVQDSSQPYQIAHTIVRPDAPMPAAAAQEAVLEIRTFRITKPEETCAVGIAVPAEAVRLPHDRLAVDSTLTAFTNIISSVKAFAAYSLDAERFATRDALTTLYNQTSFWDLLEYETNRSRRQDYKFSLLVIDLDNFKSVNDTFGHEAGDQFLRSFADILKGAVRSGDIAARYAGDQFAAILPVCDEGQAQTVARRIIDSLRTYAQPAAGGAVITGTVSVGVAVFPDHAREAKDLFLLADNMLFQAKSSGKDRLSVPSEQDNVELLKSLGEKSIMILEALANRRIVPYFQPIMNVSDQRIGAVEVLTRIVLPDRVVPAAEFIETVESMGAIGRLDYQLIELALARVRETGYRGDLFVNLSPKVLILSDFMPTVRRLLRDYGLEPTRVIFEITERDTVKNLALIVRFITELKREGFRFAIDDFGSGYSSFHYIKAFQVDYLKVDGEFIRHMAGNGTVERHIVTSIAALAAHLGIKTIAEYVETPEILGEVRSAGIEYAQGYYIQRPSPDLR
jgi:diguanylate cyclase (GGDEF)-like protein